MKTRTRERRASAALPMTLMCVGAVPPEMEVQDWLDAEKQVDSQKK